MKKLFVLAVIVMLSASLSIISAQDDEDGDEGEGGLLPPGLPVITPENVDQVVEIAAIGNGGPGQLYWSPDGKTLAMNNAYGIWLHDADDLTAEPRFIPEPSLDLLHFSDDSTKLVAWHGQYSDTPPARVWDVPTAEKVSDWDAADISANPNWRYQTSSVLTGPLSDQHYVTVFWDVVANSRLYDYRVGVGTLYFSRDRRIAAMSDKTNQTFEVATGQPMWLYSDSSHHQSGSFVSLSSSGGMVLVYDNRQLTLRRASDGEAVRVLQTEGDLFWSVIGFTPDDRYVVGRNHEFAGTNKFIRVWDVTTGNIASSWQIGDTFATGSYVDLTIMDNGELLASAAEAGLIIVYDLTTGQEIHTIQSDEVLSDVAYSADGCCLATITASGVLSMWNVESGETRSTVDRYRDMGTVKAISPDGQMLITSEFISGGLSSQLVIRDLQRGQVIREVTQRRSFFDGIVVFHPNGKQFATSDMGPYSVERSDWIWDYPGLDNVWDIAYSPDGAYIAIAAGSDYLEFQSRPPTYLSLGIYSADGFLMASIPEANPRSGGFTAVAFSPDGRYLAADRGNINIWEVKSLLANDLTPLAELKRDEPIGDLAFSPDGKQLIAGHALMRTGGDGFASLVGPCSAVIWDVEDTLARARTSEQPIESHHCIGYAEFLGPGRFVSYSPNGDMLLIYGSDRQWMGNSSVMTLLDPLTGHVLRSFPDQLSFVMSPDGTFMISEGSDQRLHYWGIIPQDED